MDDKLEILINDFKKLHIEDKRSIVVNEAKEQFSLISKVYKYYNNNPIKLSKELANFNKDNASEDDYLDAAFSYINILNNVLGDIFEKLPTRQ